jgi:hypothetical protein
MINPYAFEMLMKHQRERHADAARLRLLQDAVLRARCEEPETNERGHAVATFDLEPEEAVLAGVSQG